MKWPMSRGGEGNFVPPARGLEALLSGRIGKKGDRQGWPLGKRGKEKQASVDHGSETLQGSGFQRGMKVV